MGGVRRHQGGGGAPPGQGFQQGVHNAPRRPEHQGPPGQLVPLGGAALLQGQLHRLPLRGKQGEAGLLAVQGGAEGGAFRPFAGKEPAGVGGLRHHQLHVPVQGRAGAQQGHPLHAGPRQTLAPGGPVDEHPLGAQLLKAAGQRGELPGRRRPGKLHISVGQGAEHRHRPQGGHHVGEIHHLQRGIAQGEHTPRCGEQIAFFQVQIGLLRARHQVGALPVPAHRGQAQALLPQLRHQAAHGGGFARVFTETNYRHRRGIPHQGRQKLFHKTDEPIVIDLNNLKASFNIKSATVWEGNKEIPSQLDDLNGDARADELAFLIDMPAKSNKSFRIILSSEKSEKNYPARTYAQMKAYGHNNKFANITGFSAAGTENVYSFVYHHGPAIESELVAYRIYFNEKQTVDPYSKVNKRLEIKETCFYPTKAQRANGYGDDALRVYNSGGVGALKGWNGTEATHIKPVVNRTERVLASGPVRAIVEAEVIGWEYQGNDLNMINRYTIYGGHRDMKVDVLFDRPLKQEVFAAGVQILKEGGHMSDHKGLTGSWGTDWPVTDTIGYVKETTGMGTFIPKYIGKEVQDGSNYLYTLQAPGQQHFHYYVTFTSKKESFGFKDMKDWFNYLPQWRKELEHPCKITIK